MLMCNMAWDIKVLKKAVKPVCDPAWGNPADCGHKCPKDICNKRCHGEEHFS